MVLCRRVASRAVLVPLIVVSLGFVACSNATAPTSIPQVEEPVSSTDIKSSGAQLYAAQCQSCHGNREGVGATGIAPLHNETGHTWHHPDTQLREWIMNGKLGFGQMPAFQDRLSESEVDVILAFIKTLWTDEQRQTQSDISQRYQEALNNQNKD